MAVRRLIDKLFPRPNQGTFATKRTRLRQVVEELESRLVPAAYYWDTTTTGLWAAAANWSTNATSGSPGAGPPISTDTAQFNQSAVNGNETVQLGAPAAITGITFSNTGTTLIAASAVGSQTLTVGTSGLTLAAGAGAVTIGNATNQTPITLGGAQSWTNNSSSLLTIVNNVTNGGNLLTVAGAGSVAINGVIGSGAGGLSRTGVGVLTLFGANTFAGNVFVDRGGSGALTTATIRSGANNVLPDTATLNVNGGTIDLAGFNDTVAGIYLGKDAAGQSGNVNQITTGAGTLTLNGNVTHDTDSRASANLISGNLNLGSATRTISNSTDLASNGSRQQMTIAISANVTGTGTAGIISNAGAGPGAALILSGANSYPGTTTIGSGYLRADSSTALGNGGNITFGNANSTLQYTANSAATDWATRLKNSSQAIRLDTNGQSVTLAGIVDSSNTGGLTKLGGGTLTLSGANTYTSTTTVNEGTLLLDMAAGGTIVATSNLTLGGGAFSLKGATSGSTAQTLGNLTVNAGNGRIVVDANGGSGTTLTLGNTWSRSAGGTLAIDLSIANSALASTGGLAAGTQTGTQAILGYATVKDSTGVGFAANVGGSIVRYVGADVLLASSNGAGTNYKSNPTGSGTYLTLSAFNPSFNSLSFDTSAATGANALDLNDDLVTLTSGALLMTGSNALTIQNGQLGASGSELIVHQAGTGTLTIAGLVSGGSGLLTKTGSGMLVISGENFYTGGTNVTAGVLNVQNPNALGTTGAINVSNGAALQLQGNLVMPTRTLNLVGGGASNDGALRSISGVNVFSGPITLGTTSAGSPTARINTDAGTLFLTGTIGAVGSNAGDSDDLIVGGAGNTWISGAIGTLSGSLTKDGAGTLTLASTNYYMGGTFLNGGTVTAFVAQTVGGSNGGPFGEAGTISFGGGTLQYSPQNQFDYSPRFSTAPGQAIKIDTNNQNVTFAASLASPGGSLTKQGYGTLTLSGVNTFSGGATVNRGVLLLSGANNMPASGAVTVNAGGTFSVADGTARIATTVAGLTLNDGATLGFDWNGAATDTVTSSAPVTASGRIGIVINNVNTPSGANLVLLSAPGGGLTTGGATYYLVNNTGYTATLTVTDTSIKISSYVSGTPLTTNAFWIGNKVSGSNTVGVDNVLAFSTGAASNWSTTSGSYAATGLVPGATANAVFSATGATQQSSISLGADMSLGEVRFSDATPITINGPNTLNLTTSSSVIVVSATSAATTTINANLNLGAVGGPQNMTVSTATGKTLTLGGTIGSTNPNNTLRFDASSGAGGAVNVSGLTNYAGATTINAGTITFTSTANKTYQSTSSSLNVNGGTLNVDGTFDVGTMTMNGTNTGALNLNAGGTLVVRSAASFNNFFNVAGGVFTTVNAPTVDSNTASAILRVTGGSFNMGAASLLIAGTSGASGELTITGGAINHGLGGSLGLGAAGSGGMAVVNVQGGILNNAGSAITLAEGNGGSPGAIGIVNLNGGTLLTGDVLRSSQGNQRNGYGLVNFNGGVLKPSSSTTTFLSADGLGSGGQPNNYGFEVRKNYVNAGGAIFDTNGFNVSIPAALQAPTGNGVSSAIGVANGGSGYIGAPAVTITDAGVTVTGTTAYQSYQITGLSSTAGIVVGQSVSGVTFGSSIAGYVTNVTGSTVTLSNWVATSGVATLTFKGAGATAYATISGGAVSGIVLTNPGVGYVAPSMSLLGGLETGGVAASGFTVSTSANSTGGLVKTGVGTLTLSNYNSYGTTSLGNTVNGGTLQLATTGSSLGSIAAPLTVNVGALDLNGTSQTVGNLAGAGGVIVNNLAGTPSILTIGGGNGTGGSYAGTIANNSNAGTSSLSLVKTGTGTISLTGSNTYTGSTTINRGVLQLDFATNQVNVLSASTSLVLAGGALAIKGAGGATDAQTVAGLTLNAGASSIAPNLSAAASLSLTLGVVSRNVGSTLDIGNLTLGSGSLNTTTGTANAILSAGGVAFATIGGADWAAKNASNTQIVSLSSLGGYSNSTATTLSGAADVSSGIDTTLAGNANVSSLRFNQNESRTIAVGANVLTTGGILITGAVATAGSQIVGGTLRGASGKDLVVIQNSGQSFSIGSTIADHGSATGLTKSGAGTLLLAGMNTYTGPTYVNVGTLSIQNGSALADGSTTFVAGGATLALLGSETIGSLSGSGALSLGGNTLTVGADGTSTVFSGDVGGPTGNLVKTGGGTLTLSGTNTYGGTTTVSGGTLQAGGASAFGVNSAVTLANAAGAALDLGGFNVSIGSLTGGGASGGNVRLGGGRLTVGGDGTSPAAYGGVISGVGPGSSLTKVGSGTLALSGANWFAGDTTIAGGILRADSTGALSPISAVVLANAGGVGLDISGNDNAIGSLTGGGASGGNVSLGAATLTIGGDGQTRAAYAGVISGAAGSIQKIGSGTLTLSGVNTFGGTATVGQGTLALSGASSTFGANTVNLTLAGGTLDLATLSRTVGAVSITAPAMTGGSVVQNGTLTASSYAVSNTFGNAIVSATLNGAGGVTKSGAGTLTLLSANGYLGATAINDGVVLAQDAAALGSTVVGTTVASGAALHIAGAVLNAEPLTLNGSGFSGDGALRVIGLGSFTGPISLGSAARINVDAATLNLTNTTTIGGTGGLTFGGAGTVNVSAAIGTGAGGALTKDGSGTLTLRSAAANTYTGATTVNGGTLIVDFLNATSATDLVNGGSALVLGGPSTLQVRQKSATTTSQSFNGTTLNSGAAAIIGTQVTSGSLTVALGGLARNAGGTVNFTFPAGGAITTSTANEPSGILGPWATTGSGTTLQYVANNGSGNIVTFTGAIADGGNLSSLTNATTNYSYSATATVAGASTALTANTLRYTGGATTTELGASAGNANTLTLNGLMNAGTNTLTIQRTGSGATGGLIIGATNELVILANTQATTISAPIKNGSGAGAIVYTGAGTLTLSGANTYTGGTTLNSGTLTAAAATQSTTLSNNVLGAGPLTLNGGTLNLRDNGDGTTAAQTLVYGNNTTVNGNTTITVDRVATSTSKTIQLGTLALNNNVALTVTNTNSYGLRFGAATLNGNATFAPSGTAGLVLGSLDFGNAPRSLTMSGAGELRVGMTGGATNVAANTNWNLSSGTLTAVAAGALGGSNNTITLSNATANTGTLQFLTDGSGAGLGNGMVETIAHGDNVVLVGSKTITVGKLGAAGNAANKKVQLGSLIVPNGQQLTYNLNNGASLEFAGTVTLGSVGGSSGNRVVFSGGTAGSNAPINQGLILSGVVQGGGFWMGPGFVQLTNPNNTFSSADWILNGEGNSSPAPGILSFTNDGAMGAATNVYALGQVNQGSPTLQFDGTFAVNHQISLGSSNSSNAVLDVTQGNVATLAVPLNGGAFNTGGFSKTGNGVLALSADNDDNGAGDWWQGPLAVNAGAVRVQHTGALGLSALVASSLTIGATTVSQSGAAVQLDGSLNGLTIAEPFTIAGSGLNSGGALESFSGTNTLAGPIALSGAATIGANSGTTLNVNNQISGAQSLTIAGAGSVNLNAGLAANVIGLTKIGSGTLTIGVDNSANTGAIAVNAGTLRVGDANGFGKTAGNLTVGVGATLIVDNAILSANDRLGGNAKTISLGGALDFTGAADSLERLGGLTVTAGRTTINTNTSGTLSFTSQVSRAVGGVVDVVSGGSSSVQFASSAPALTPASGILPGWFVGADFATHGGVNTPVTAFNAYTAGDLGTVVATTGTFKPSGAQTAVNTKTINALNLAGTIGATINPGQTLTLTSGGLINSGSGSIAGGTLLPSAELIANYSGNSAIGSVIAGSAGLTKTGAGNLTLTRQNTYTGQTTINQGTLTLGGGSNTLAVNQALMLNAGTLALGANNQYVGALSSSNVVEGAGGAITGSGILTTNAASGTFAGNVSGSVTLTKAGANTLTLTSASDTTGTINVIGGGLTLKDGGRFSAATAVNVRSALLTLDNSTGTKDVADRIGSATSINLDGGTLVYSGRNQLNSTESLTVTASGLSTISANPGNVNVSSAELTLESATRNAGAVVRLTPSTGLLGSSGRIRVTGDLAGLGPASGLTPINGIVPGVYQQSSPGSGPISFVSYVPGLGFGGLNQAGFPETSSGLTGALPTSNVQGGGTVAFGGQTINSLNSGNVTFANAANVLTVNSGMVVVKTNDSDIGTTSNRGVLTAGVGAAELFLIQLENGLANPGGRGVHSVIADNGSPLTLVVANQVADARVAPVLTANNGYSGGTVVNGTNGAKSGVYLHATTAGATPIPAGGLTINNAFVAMGNVSQVVSSASQQIAASNVVTLVGSAGLWLSGNNTLAGLNFNSNGGTVAPVVNIGINAIADGTGSISGTSGGSLVLTGAVTSTPTNVAVTPVIQSGSLDLNGQSAASITVSALPEGNAVWSGANLTPQNGLRIDAGLVNGGVVKKGSGVLNLTAANTFTGQLTVEDGVLNVATINVGVVGPLGNSSAAVILGKTGGQTGTLEYTGGTTASARPFTMAGGGAGAFQIDTAATSLTLSGLVNENGSGGGLAKTGPGTLVLSGANTYTGATTVSGGVLKAGVASVANVSGALGVNSAVVLANAEGAALDLNGFDTQIGSLAGGGASGGSVVLGNKTLTIAGTNGSPVAYGGVLSGASGSLVKSGAGAQTLSGTNTYTGATTVNGGILLVDGSLAAASAVAVTSNADNATATLGGSGTINGSVSLSPTAAVNRVNRITGGGVGSIGTLAIGGSLSLGAGSISYFDVTSTTVLDSLHVSGAVAVSSGALLRVPAGLALGTYHLVTAGSGLTNNFTLQNLDGSPVAGSYSLNVTATSVDLVVGVPVPSVTGVAPFVGPTSGGNTVVIAGSGFSGLSGPAAVVFHYFDTTSMMDVNTNATSYVVNSLSQITAVAPARVNPSYSLVDVIVTNGFGSSINTAADNYSYAAPQVTSVVVNGAVFATLTGATWTAGNPTVTVASTAALHAGDQLSSTGNGFPMAAAVLAVTSGTTFTLASNPTATQSTATTISAVNAPQKSGTILTLTNATWTNGGTTVTVASTTGLLAGQYVTAAGLPANAVVAVVTGPTSFTLSAPASADQLTPTTIAVANGAIARDHYGNLVNLTGAGSVVEHLLVTFNQPVTLDANAFAIANLASSVTTNSVAPILGNVAVVAAGVPGAGSDVAGYTQYVLNFVPGSATNSFTNADDGGVGNAFTTVQNSLFQLNAIGSKVHAGLSDTAANRSDNFWSLYGAVNPSDILITGTPGGGNDELRIDGIALSDTYTTFGSSVNGTTPPFNRQFDRDLDGDVDGIDLSHMYVNFGTIWLF